MALLGPYWKARVYTVYLNIPPQKKTPIVIIS